MFGRKLAKELKLLREELAQLKGQRRGAEIYEVSYEGAPARRVPAEGKVLDWETMWQMYIKNEVVRMCVDTKKDMIASMPWEIVPTRQDYSPEHKLHLERFFQNPNADDENLQSILSKLCLDLFVFDAAVIEKVRDKRGRLVEIVNRYGPSFKPIIKNERLVGWKQELAGRKPVEFALDELIYIKANPTTRSPYGISPLETLVVSVASDIYAANYHANYFTENEIPPGVLVFPDGLDEASFRRNLEAFRRERAKQYAIRIITGNAKWVRFHATNREQQVFELQKLLIWRIAGVYKIDPTELGLIENATRATAEIQARTSFRKSILPILKLIEYHFNTEIVQAEFGYDDVEFRFNTQGHDPSLGKE